MPPREQLCLALARGPEEGAQSFARLDCSYLAFAQGFRAWIAAIHAWLAERHGIDAAAEAVDVDAVLRAAERSGVHAGEGLAPTPSHGELAALDGDVLLARFDALAGRRRAVHDLYHDWVTALLSHVYRRLGVAELEHCLRYTGHRTLLRWMPRDLANPPEERVRRWAAMLLGNFAQIRIEEDEEKFVLSQSRCGSCGRQLEAGCYGPEPGFAVVGEKHPVTFNRGDVPVYRTHVAVLHYLIPIEQNGVPWPVIECPAGQASGPCRLLLYKNPARTPREHWEWLSRAATSNR